MGAYKNNWKVGQQICDQLNKKTNWMAEFTQIKKAIKQEWKLALQQNANIEDLNRNKIKLEERLTYKNQIIKRGAIKRNKCRKKKLI